MSILKTIFASICLWSGLGVAAFAIPVQFSYVGNPLDLSVLEDWEQAWIEEGPAPMHPPRERVEIVLEVECDITGGVWSCSETFDSFLHPYYEPYGDMTLISRGTFADWIGVNAFKVDATGQVVEWKFVGSEVGAGDFVSSHTGDFWEFHNLYPEDYVLFYCHYTYGEAGIQGQWSPSYTACANGEPVQKLEYINKIEIAGIGVWTVDTGEHLIATPLPAGLSLLLGGLGGLAWLRRRQSGRAGT